MALIESDNTVTGAEPLRISEATFKDFFALLKPRVMSLVIFTAVAGMIVAPCSIRTLSAIAWGQLDNLLVRAADVQLKERRRLVLLVRESPLHLGHLRAMTQATEIGAIIAPPMPAFYLKPQSLDDVVEQIACRAINLLGIPGLGGATAASELS